MRFIRDIIAEQRNASPVRKEPQAGEPHAAEKPVGDAAPAPATEHEPGHHAPLDHRPQDHRPQDQWPQDHTPEAHIPEAQSAPDTNEAHSIGDLSFEADADTDLEEIISDQGSSKGGGPDSHAERSIEAAIAAELAGLTDAPATAEPSSASPDPAPEPAAAFSNLQDAGEHTPQQHHADEEISKEHSPVGQRSEAHRPEAHGPEAHGPGAHAPAERQPAPDTLAQRPTDPAEQQAEPAQQRAEPAQQRAEPDLAARPEAPSAPAEPQSSIPSAPWPTASAGSRDATTPTEAEPQPTAPVDVPQPAAGRSAKRSGRVRTRLLGFGGPQETSVDPFRTAEQPSGPAQPVYPVGWLIVVDGPGRGSSFTIHDGVAHIGRNADQAVALTFGDTSISRENHAAIAYDDEQRTFFLGHGGKANLVRLNGKPVLSTEELQSEDTIRIGETTLRFVALCGRRFSWSQDPARGGRDVAAE